MTYSIYQLLWLFAAYSVIGWGVEVIFVALTLGKLSNRGFLNGPVCPIYGFGMVGVLVALGAVADDFVLLFFGGMILCTLVEFIGGWALNKIFHMRWWDYSGKPFNLKGYVCLGYSVMWGMGVVLAVRVVHPFIMNCITGIPAKLGAGLLIAIYAAYAADLAVTLKVMIGITKSLGELERVAEGLRQLGDDMSSLMGTAVVNTTEAVEKGKVEFDERAEHVRSEWDERTERYKAELVARKEQLEARNTALLKSLGSVRFLKVFPDMRRSSSSVRLIDELKRLRDRSKDYQLHGAFKDDGQEE